MVSSEQVGFQLGGFGVMDPNIFNRDAGGVGYTALRSIVRMRSDSDHLTRLSYQDQYDRAAAFWASLPGIHTFHITVRCDSGVEGHEKYDVPPTPSERHRWLNALRIMLEAAEGVIPRVFFNVGNEPEGGPGRLHALDHLNGMIEFSLEACRMCADMDYVEFATPAYTIGMAPKDDNPWANKPAEARDMVERWNGALFEAGATVLDWHTNVASADEAVEGWDNIIALADQLGWRHKYRTISEGGVVRFPNQQDAKGAIVEERKFVQAMATRVDVLCRAPGGAGFVDAHGPFAWNHVWEDGKPREPYFSNVRKMCDMARAANGL